MKNLLLTICLCLGFCFANAQTTTTINSGTTVTNSGSSFNLSTAYPGPTGSFINNGTFTDITSPDTFIVNGDFLFSGTGTTTVYNFKINQGYTTLNSTVTVKGITFIIAGDSLKPNSHLSLSAGASIINNGYLTGTNSVLGLVTNTTASTGACPFSPTLSMNVSGANMIYQWQSSPDNSTWTNVATGGTSATYVPTVTIPTYYRCLLSTTTANGGYSQGTPGVLLTPTGVPTITSVSPLIGYNGSTVTITGTGFNTTAANNIVYFGSVKASVTSASATSLSVTLPVESRFSYVTVDNTTCGLAAYSPKPYLPSYNNAGNVSATVNFDPLVDFASGGNGTQGAVIADIDGDGKADVLALNQTTGNFSVFLNTASAGSFTTSSLASPVNVTTGTTPSYIAVGDLDGDGKPDVAVSNYGSSTVFVYLNTSTSGSVSFAAPISISTTNPQQIRIADIDGDGRADLIVGVLLSSTNVNIFRNTSSIGSLSFAGAYSMSLGTHANTLAVGDIDGDGKPDIVVCEDNGGFLFVMQNTSVPGSISLVDATGALLSSLPLGIELADIDGDGKLDLVFGNSVSGSNNFTIVPNTSSPGSFSLGSPLSFTTTHVLAYSVKIADFDGDGKPDIAVSYTTNARVGLYRNTSTSGSFSLAPEVEFLVHSGTPNREIAVGDLDGDGKADIVTTNQTLNNISVFRNDPLVPISGPTQVCAGGLSLTTITLTESSQGGTWTSSSTTTASAGSTTGVVTGVAAGVVTITFNGLSGTGIAGNYTTYTVTVNAAPGTISGTLTLPAGTNSTLTDAPSGGTWTSVSPTIASIGSSTGIVNGLLAGTTNITYSAGGCQAATVVTVNSLTGLNWYSVTTGSNASVLNNWWSNNNNTGYQPNLFSNTGDTWIFQSAMTSTAALSLAGNVSVVSGGTFTPLTSSNTTIGGNFTQASGGSFVPNSGTVIFSGTAVTISAASMTTPTTNCFNNLTFNASTASTYTISSNLLLTGSLNNTNTSGTIGLGGNTLTIGGSWHNAGPFTTGAGHQIIYNGTSPITVTGNQ